jgi:Flp pilus assembly protein TadG
MSDSSNKGQRRLVRFHRDQRGGVAVMFTLAVIPIAFLSLVMIDFSRASTAHSNMQEALDASTLLVARSSAITGPAIQAAGNGALIAQIATNLGITVASDTFAPGANNTIVGDAHGTVQTMLAGHLFFGGSIPISAHSEVTRSMNKLEIAMVLDTTGSMAGTKITNLQSAANGFIDTMSTASAQSSIANAVKISIVPFSNTVKISAPVSLSSYAGFAAANLPTWMDGRAQGTPFDYDIFTTASAKQTDRIDRFQMLKQMGQTWDGCVENRSAPYDVTDDPPIATAATLPSVGTSLSTAQAASMFAPYFWPDEPDLTSGSASFYTKNSYGKSLNDYLVDGYAANLAAGTLFTTPQGRSAKYSVAPKSGTNLAGSKYGPNAGCTMQQMLPLDTNFAAMKTTISGLVAGGETNIPIGLAWGWHSISHNAPLGGAGGVHDPVAYGTAFVTKIVVLMTDGDNTMDTTSNSPNNSTYHGYGLVWQNKLGIGGTGSTATIQANAKATSNATRTAALAARMTLLCSNMKAKGIVIYTVGVGVSAASKSLLQACATTTDQYYDVTSSGSNMSAAFSAIAGSIQNLRISL